MRGIFSFGMGTLGGGDVTNRFDSEEGWELARHYGAIRQGYADGLNRIKVEHNWKVRQLIA